MIAGVVLGPSLLGLFFPDLQATLFPKEMKKRPVHRRPAGWAWPCFLVGTTLRLDHFAERAVR